ncbi:hypothetical protein BBL97_16900 [Vibrio parahaemolyticus]|nr:hypothetical protein FORC6_3487 [Vibrio parahaemolyticus]ODW95791.1 hypothetical protein BBL95_09990 [Vibrio parahaemolyticus]ODX04066.1 hypothetical protein BBL98_18065 [Vibrio parahaemolyticus]ODX05515.1 hypothetical protein BBL97_16900 [Vibrio parahaemolyticus]ODX12685.1 hypothetical protein BBL96_01990 [Vibrio parahaemolyticus]
MMSVLVWALFVLFLVCFLGFIYVRWFVFVEVGISDGLLKEFLNFINSKQSVEGKISTIEIGRRIKESSSRIKK